MKTYKTIIPSDISYVYNNVTELLNFIKIGLNFISESDLFDIKVIMNELIINAIKHGNNCDRSKNVYVSAFISKKNHIVMTVKDEGLGWCYKTNSECECIDDIDDIQENGRGLFIVRTLCDVIKVNSIGNMIVIMKKI